MNPQSTPHDSLEKRIFSPFARGAALVAAMAMLAAAPSASAVNYTIDTTTVPGKTIITFTGSDTWIAPGITEAEVLVVGGGGGGGGHTGGGGGGGGYIYQPAQTIVGGSTYTITVGTGGAGGTFGASSAQKGTNSKVLLGGTTLFEAVGGGAGATRGNAGTLSPGGSGGGDGSNYIGAAYTPGQGNAGGIGVDGNPYLGGGGGGAGSVGGIGNSSLITGGSGGDGSAWSISGTSTVYAGGGGGGGDNLANGGTGGTGGSGGGGAGGGGGGTRAGSNGTNGLGGGGGGAAFFDTGGTGGSGVVIISYTTSSVPASKLGFTLMPSHPQQGQPFSVTVEAQDSGGIPAAVTSDTTVTLSQGLSGSGTLTGTLSGTITNGVTSVTFTGLSYSAQDTLALIATASVGMTLDPATTDIVFPPPTKLVFTSVPAKPVAGHLFSVTVQAQDDSGTAQNVTSDTTVQIGTTGSGTLSGTSGTSGTISNGTNSVTISGLSYSAEETMTLTATRTGGISLTPATADLTFALSNLILNGDFSENAALYTAWPCINGSSGNPGAPTSWTVIGTAGINGYDTVATVLFDDSRVNPNPGHSWTSDSGRTVKDFYFQLNSGGTISQSVTTISGHTYLVTFDASTRSGYGPGQWWASAGATTFDTGTGLSGSQWQGYSFTFTGTGSDTLTFASMQNSQNLANVRVTEVVETGGYTSWANGTFANGALGDKDPTHDPDSDGVTNLQEYAFGMDPTVSFSGGIAYATGAVTTHGQPVVFPQGNDYFTVFGRRTDYLTAWLTYTVQFSAGLDIWVDNDDIANPPVQMATDGTIDAISVKYPEGIVTPSGSQKPTFSRVMVVGN